MNIATLTLFKFFAGASEVIIPILVTPPERRVLFDAENRSVTFNAENRSVTFDAENRKVIL